MNEHRNELPSREDKIDRLDMTNTVNEQVENSEANTPEFDPPDKLPSDDEQDQSQDYPEPRH